MASRSPIQLLFTFLVAIAGIAFIYGITIACHISLQEVPDVSKMPSFLSYLVISISVVLATNFGAVVGFTVKVKDSNFRKQNNWNPLNVFSSDTPTVLQTTACYLYLLGLLAAAVVWANKDFTEDTARIVPLLPQLTNSLLGAIVGALAQALGLPKS